VNFGIRKFGVQAKILGHSNSRIAKGIIRCGIEWWKHFVEKYRNFVNRWISQICEEVKAEHLLAFKRSGGVVGIGWESTGVVDLTRKFHYFRNSGIGATSDFGVESFKLPVREIPKISGPLDQGRLTAVDPTKGEISEFRES
jgi:hypothetical protein